MTDRFSLFPRKSVRFQREAEVSKRKTHSVLGSRIFRSWKVPLVGRRSLSRIVSPLYEKGKGFKFPVGKSSGIKIES